MDKPRNHFSSLYPCIHCAHVCPDRGHSPPPATLVNNHPTFFSPCDIIEQVAILYRLYRLRNNRPIFVSNLTCTHRCRWPQSWRWGPGTLRRRPEVLLHAEGARDVGPARVLVRGGRQPRLHCGRGHHLARQPPNKDAAVARH